MTIYGTVHRAQGTQIRIRTRSTRTTASDSSTSGINDNSSNLAGVPDRRSTGASRHSTRSQKTIATASTDTSRTSGKLKQ